MRILIVDTYHSAFLRAHYTQRPRLAGAPYEVQWRTLMDRFFGTSDAYSHFLGELGHDAHEVVVNCEPLQRAWAVEHGIRAHRSPLARKRPLVLDQAEEFRPDVVYVQLLSPLTPKVLRGLSARARLLVGQIATEIPPSTRIEPFDVILTSFPHYVDRLRADGVESAYLPIGFDPRVLGRLENGEAQSGAVFVGALGRSPRWRANRLLERAAERVPIDFWGYKEGVWPPDCAMTRRYRGEVWGLDMYGVLARARIAVNRHGDVAEQYANNMRLYEATGVGTLLITDAKRNLSDLFEPGKEVVTYASEDELVQKIHRYLRDEDDRIEIARAGQARTLRDHTYRHRMRELVEILRRYLP